MLAPAQSSGPANALEKPVSNRICDGPVGLKFQRSPSEFIPLGETSSFEDAIKIYLNQGEPRLSSWAFGHVFDGFTASRRPLGENDSVALMIEPASKLGQRFGPSGRDRNRGVDSTVRVSPTTAVLRPAGDLCARRRSPRPRCGRCWSHEVPLFTIGIDSFNGSYLTSVNEKSPRRIRMSQDSYESRSGPVVAASPSPPAGPPRHGNLVPCSFVRESLGCFPAFPEARYKPKSAYKHGRSRSPL